MPHAFTIYTMAYFKRIDDAPKILIINWKKWKGVDLCFSRNFQNEFINFMGKTFPKFICHNHMVTNILDTSQRFIPKPIANAVAKHK